MKASKQGSKGVSRKTASNEISLYEGGMLTDTCIAISLKRLKEAFPKMQPAFFNLLSERIIANGFSDKRLADAVNNVIDNFEYKELNVSDIIKFDRKVKMHTYTEAAAMVTAGKATFEDFEKREINGNVLRILKTDLL